MQCCREDPTPQSARVVAVQSDLAPTASSPGRDHSLAARTCQRDTPILDNQGALLVRYLDNVLKTGQPLLKQFYSATNRPPGRDDIEAQTVRCNIPESPDPFAIVSGQWSLYDDESPCVPARPGKCRRRVHSRPRDIGKIDYGLPEDFREWFMAESCLQISLTMVLAVPGSNSARLVPNTQDPSPDLDEFAFIIPLDCRTSTPVASRKRGLRKGVGFRQGQGGSTWACFARGVSRAGESDMKVLSIGPEEHH